MATTQNIVNGRSGTVINKVRTTSFSQTSTTASVLPDGTPTTSNMTQLCSLTIAPESSSNILIFNFAAPIGAFSNVGVVFSLFQGTTLLNTTLRQNAPGTTYNQMGATLFYQQAAGTTSSTTYYIYYAAWTGSLATSYINSNGSGSSLGSSLSYTFTITEEIA